jgi:histidine triad (HIT) family protein
MTGQCLFCRIAARDIDSHVIHDDDQVLAFLDIRPIRPGHTLVVPKRHFDYFEATPADILSSIVTVGQQLAIIQKRVYGVPRVGFFFSGMDIAHVHAHVVPMHDKTDITSARYIVEQDLTFRLPAPSDNADLAACAAELKQAWSSDA